MPKNDRNQAPSAAGTVADGGPDGKTAAETKGIENRYEKAQVLDTRKQLIRAPVGGEGGPRIHRLRLVRSDFKYPLLRLEEELEEANGTLRLVKQEAVVADHVVVKPKPGVSEEKLLEALKPLGAQLRQKKPASGIWLVSFANPTIDTVPDAVKEIARLGLAQVAEPDFVVHANVLPNDTSFSSLWGMHNTGQSGGTVDADIDAAEAWDLTTGSLGVLVGVIDTGIDHTHPDLAANMWTNPNEIAGNGIDDDGNGYIDDTRGWDFVNNDNNPIDDNNHGTHCSGTIGGAGNNGAGVVGVNWQVSLVGLKFLSSSGSGTTSDAVEATAYATDIGVTLTSNSWGGGGFSQALKDAIDAADAAGILFVAAAGNSSANSDLTTNYPSGYTSSNIIAVASTTRTDGLSSFSNYGATTVDLGAPGSEIYSTTVGNTYSTFNGTSMATPHVAGACALLKAYRPTLTHSEIKSLIVQSADPIASLAGKCVSGGRLNVYNAMLFSSDITMTPGGGLAASGPMGGPLTPSSVTYTLTNRASTSATWTAAADQPWLALSSSGGTLAAGATATLTVSLTSAVNSLNGGMQNGTVTISNTTTGRSQTRSVSLDILPPVIISEDLDANPGWSVTGEWNFGQPAGAGAVSHGYPDPAAGATGTKVFGVNLNGDYSITPGGPWYVTAGPFDLSLHRAAQLEFQRWLNTDMPYYVTATIEVSNNGTTWTNIWTNPSTVADTAWSSQRYDISSVADQHSQVWIRWGYKVNNVADVWAYSGWNIDDVQIRAVSVKNLAFVPPASLTEGDSPATVTLTVTPVPTASQTVTLVSSDATQATVPASIVVPAGQTTATFQITPVDDALADGTQSVTVTASSAGFPDKTALIDIHDSETRALTLAVPAAVAEGAGVVTGQATVGLNAAADTEVRVTLASSDVSEVVVPSSVIIPAGQTSAPVTLTVPEDSAIDGTQTAVITASVQNWTAASGSIAVTDNEALTLSLTLPASLLEGQGGTAPVGSVVLTGIATAAVEVTLASDNVTELTVPATLTIQPGQSSASFPVTILNDGIVDGSQMVTVTATAAGFSDGTGQIIVHDADTPAVPSSPQPIAGAPEAHPDSDLAWSYATGTGGVPDNYDVYFGTNPLLGTAELAASAVTATSHSMARLGLNTTYYWRIVSRKGAITTEGPVWSFTVPPAGNPVRFAWSTIASPKQADEPFNVTVTGYDAFDNVAAPFNGTATIRPVKSDSAIVITEVNPNTPDEIEFVNVSTQTVDISGWIVSIYDVDLWPNRKTFTIPAGTTCAPGGIFRLQEFGTAPGAFPLYYYGSNINWTSDSLSTVAVLLSKPDGTMVDFMCAASATPSSITSPAVISPSQWTGGTIPAPTTSTYDYARQGNSDSQTAANWTTATPGLGTLNPGLTVPFAGTSGDVAVAPASVTFASGVWTGDVRVRAPVVGLQLRAEDAANHRGDSNAFTVTSLGPLTLAATAGSYQENAGTIASGVTVTLPAAAAADVTVTITSSDATEVSSSTITVPAGQLSASGPLVIVDDTDLDGTQTATLDASAACYTPSAMGLGIHDDETTTLTLTAPASAGENAGVLAGQGSVSVPVAVAADVHVALASTDVSEITVPAEVTIPAGATSASFDITVVQDALLDGAQNVTLTATVVNWTSGTASISVTDDEVSAITLSTDDETQEGVGTDPSAGVITLGGVAVADVVVALESGDTSEITVPATLTIPAGQSSVAIPGTIIDDTDLDGTQTVTISAAALGNPAVTDTIAVRDNDAASFLLSTVASPQKEGVGFAFTATAKDINDVTITAPVGGPVNLTAAGDGGALSVLPAVLTPFTSGVWTGPVRVMAPDTNVRLTVASPTASNQSNAFDVTAGPRLSVNPASYALNVAQNTSKTRTLTLSNAGVEPLNWSASTTGDIDPTLEASLAGLNARHAEITSLIPNRHDFTEGVTGTYISSGGTHMYHSGNYLSTSLASSNYVPYSDNAIVTDTTRFGAGGRYFTRKVPGLFVLAADMSGVSSFTISGSTGNHFGQVAGSVLTTTRGARTYKGFVKRAHGDSGAQSIHHMLIVENDAAASHTFSATVDSDNHVLSGISGRARLYYLLYSGLSGGNVDDAAAQAIFSKFLDVIGTGSWMTVSPASGAVAAGGSQNVSVTFSAAGLNTGAYNGGIAIASNDALTSPMAIPATMTVTPGIHHFEWDAIPSPQVVNTPVSATIRAKDAANNTVTDFEGTAALTALNTASASEATTGVGTSSTWFIHDTSYSVHRTQCIYAPGEVGGTGRLGGLAFDVATLGSPTASNFTIRLKHTSRVNYATDTSWEGGGWTTVFTGSKTLVAGWNYFTFATPFDYDGASSLMVDISFVNTASSSASYCRYTTASAARTIYYGSYSGDPLLWSGTGTYAYTSTALPNLRLVKSGTPAFVSPVATGNFASGVWTGDIRLGAVGTIEVTATAADGAKGTSTPVTTTSTGTLALTIPASATEGQGILTNAGTVTVSSPPATPLTIFLESLDTSELTVPASVVVPAGQSSVTFDVTIVNDGLLDGPVSVQARALAAGHPTVAATSTVADDDTTTVTLTLPASMTELSYSTATAQGTVSLATAAAANLTLQLSSSLPSRLTVPASAMISAGQSSASFTLTLPDNTIIDGNETATITATLAGSVPGTGTVQVIDNESRALTISSPYGSISEGAAPLTSAGYVYLSGTTPTALTITLASSDTTELTVPATITIPAGSSQGYFTLTPVNDSLQDGSQSVTLTASAPSFTNGTRSITILDDELHHFTVSTVASPQVRNGPFNVTFTAKDINNVTITAYAGAPALTAADGATALGVTPASVTGFSSGVKTQSVTVQTYASAAVLTLTDTAGGSGSSNAFAIGVGSLHHFTWDSISSPKNALTPFTVGVQARDVYENAMTSFTGSAQLWAVKDFAETTIGTGTSTTSLPFMGYYPQNRCQMIYLPAEIGASSRVLQALAFDLSSIGVSPFSNLTIRLKHTTTSSYSGTAWEAGGWTTVFQGSMSFATTGWKQIDFTTPFPYNGSSNLMVDISSNLPSSAYAYNYARYTSASPSRALYLGTSGAADPLTWDGSTPSGSLSSILPNLRLISFESLPLTPTQTTAFANGAWSGNVTVSTPGLTYLIATDAASGKTGMSNSFAVSSFGTLALSLPVSTIDESGGTVTATLSVSAAQGSDLVVALSSSKPSAATVPASVTIPAGLTSVTFPATVVQDSVLEGDQTAVITASVSGFDPGTASLTVQDDETTTVTLTLPASITEGTSSTAGQAVVQLGTTAPVDLTVTLASSLSSHLTVPATVTIPAGQSSTSFILTALNNSTIDGNQPATITATLAGSPPGTGTIQVIDNESTNIGVYLSYTTVSEVSAPLTNAGYVYLSGPVSSPLTVNLSSSDTTELTVPPSVTIPAGSSQSNYFTLTPVDDALQDGSQTVTLTASAAGFTSGTRTVSVLDDDVHHFTLTSVSTPQVIGVPFNVTFTAKNINNVTISTYAGSPVLTATEGGTSLAVSPSTVTGFTSGYKTQAVTIGSLATNAVITVTDTASGGSGSSNAFAVNPGAVSRFAWDAISSPQASSVSFPVTVRAQDTSGNTVTTFSDAAGLALVKEASIGSGASISNSYPLYNYSYYTRTQYIYLASEMGGARTLHAMALNVITPTSTLHSFAIRMKHVSKTSFTGSATWEGNGWTTVFQGDVKDLVAGWRSFAFSSPFSYNGTDSLMVDISFGNGTTAYAYSGAVQSFSAADRALTAWTNTTPGIPLGWTGTVPSATIGSLVPNVRFYSETTPAPSPSMTGNFVNGVWSGSVQCTGSNTGVALLARHAGSGASGFSGLFDVSAPLPAASLAFSSLPAQASAGTPFPVTITALDAFGNVATGFTGTASISVRQPSVTQQVCGSDVAFMASPFSTQPVMRCESVFPATELGGARPLTALALYAHFSNAQVFENFTVRLKHTTRSDYTTPGAQVWESAGWTTVYQGPVAFTTTGWFDFTFTTPFQYDGTSNLLVDLSYNNAAAPTTLPQFRRFPDPSRRMIYMNTTLATAGDPLAWNGNTPGFATSGSALQMRFTGGSNATVTPATTAAFLNGVWSGNLQISSSHPAVVLEAISGGASGLSSPIAVGQSAPTVSPEPPFSGGTSNFIGWSSVASVTGYEAQASSSPGFENPAWNGSTAGTNQIVPGLQDGAAYHYRVRSLVSAAAAPQNWSQADRQEFLGNTFSGTSGSSMPGDVALNLLSTTDTVMTEDFDETDTSWSSTILPVTPGGGATTEKIIATAGPNTSPALPVNQNTDRVGRLGGFVHPMMADTAANNFADGVIEGYFAPENFTTNVFARLMLRATQTSPTGSPYGYGAQITFTMASQVSVDLVTVLGGNASSLSRLSLVSTTFGASDNLKVRLSANGPVLTLNAWKVSIVGGVITETPLTLSSGITTMSVTDYHFASGRAGLSLSISGSGNKLLVDDVRITKKNPTYTTSGTVTAAIAPPAVSSWGGFHVSRDISGAGTSLLVDLLDGAGNVLATNLTDGQNLGALPALDGIKSVRLRASLLTSNSSVTPVLKSWSVRYNSNESGNMPGVWSNVVTSTQDGTPPVITVPDLTTAAASASLAGMAADAVSGVASVTLNSLAAFSSNGFATWSGTVSGLVDGSNSVTVSASDNAVPPNTTSVTAIVYRIVTPAADSDGDGISDLMQHALAIPVANPEPRSMLPAATVQTDIGTGERFLTLDYRRRIQRAGLTYRVETSDDMLTWSATGGDVIEQSVTPTGDGVTETVRVRVTPAIDAAAKKFVRLNVTVQ